LFFWGQKGAFIILIGVKAQNKKWRFGDGQNY
jgi:hypothetical protein